MLFRAKSKAPNNQATPAAAKDVQSPENATSAPGDVSHLTPEEAKRRAALAKHFAAAFGEIIAILMRAPEYKNFAISDLEWLVVPAIATRQFFVSTAQSKTSGLTAPVGAVLWARVSPEIDGRLSASASLPVKLAANEWKSGDILWVVAAVGDQRVLHGMLSHLQQKDWSGKPVKILARAPDGTPKVATLKIKAA